MVRQRTPGPLREALRGVVVRVVEAEVVRKLTPHNQFLQKRSPSRRVAPRRDRLQCHPLGGDLAEVEVRRQVRQTVNGRIAAGIRITAESMSEEMAQNAQRGGGTRRDTRHFADRPVDTQSASHAVPVYRARVVRPNMSVTP
jgi:hypothetical protein